MTVYVVPFLKPPDLCVLLSSQNLLTRCRRSLILFLLFLTAPCAFSQGGPPYYTNNPGTPENLNWEINLGYMPFFYSGHSVSHVPDVDIDFGLGDRIQLKNAPLRVQNPFRDRDCPILGSRGASTTGISPAVPSGSPQACLNNLNHAVQRGIASSNNSFELPAEFSKKFGPVDVDYEIGYQFVHNGPDGWLKGWVVGHDFTEKLEVGVVCSRDLPSFRDPTQH
jgi:hypothetical protein